MSMNLPILLTIIRIAIIPVLVLVYLLPGRWTHLTAAALFSVAAATDWLDGYLARRLGQTTRFGAFLDPVADKLIVVTAVVLLTAHHHSVYFTLPALVIVGRELVMASLREWMAEMNERGIIAVTRLAKFKTGVQIAAVIVLLAFPPDSHIVLVALGYGLLDMAAGLTLISMISYLRTAWPVLRRGLDERS
jgi:CDP-diacylglycerol--glycerol-3-phosphate 3-phosphatidyltransferase